MQGIIVVPNGDVWALDFGDDKVVHMLKGDPSRAKFYCKSTDGKPNKESPCKLSGPFHLAINQLDRTWISNAMGDTVTRFPASDPSKVECCQPVGKAARGWQSTTRAIAWITNTFGAGLTLETKLRILRLKLVGGALAAIDQIAIKELLAHPGLGSVSILRPDGSPWLGSPINCIWGACAVPIDGNEHAWVARFAPNGGIVQLCGARTETCPPRHEDWRCHLPTRRLQGRRQCRCWSRRQSILRAMSARSKICRILPRATGARGRPLDPLLRTGIRGVLRHGQACACAAHRSGAPALMAMSRRKLGSKGMMRRSRVGRRLLPLSALGRLGSASERSLSERFSKTRPTGTRWEYA